METLDYKKRLQEVKKTLEFLNTLKISFSEIILHPEVIGCTESKRYYDATKKFNSDQYGLCKNLFIRDKKGKNFWLLIIDYLKEIDLKDLRLMLNSSKLMLAMEKDLIEILKIESGSVSIFNLINDTEKRVQVLIDGSLLNKKLLAFHPNYNGATIFIKPEEALRFLGSLCYKHSIIDTTLKKEKEESLQYVL